MRRTCSKSEGCASCDNMRPTRERPAYRIGVARSLARRAVWLSYNGQLDIAHEPHPARSAKLMAPHMRSTSAILGLAVLALLLVPLGLSLWLDARWFGAQGLQAIFGLRLRTEVGLGLAAAAVAGVFSGVNLAWAAWSLRRVASKEDRDSRGMATILAAV